MNRRTDTEEGRKFWALVDRVAAGVDPERTPVVLGDPGWRDESRDLSPSLLRDAEQDGTVDVSGYRARALATYEYAMKRSEDIVMGRVEPEPWD